MAELENLYVDGNQGSPAFFAAQAYAEMNRVDPAFEWLEKAYEAHELEMTWLKSEPQFKNLNDDPRFQDLLKRVGFEVSDYKIFVCSLWDPTATPPTLYSKFIYNASIKRNYRACTHFRKTYWAVHCTHSH